MTETLLPLPDNFPAEKVDETEKNLLDAIKVIDELGWTAGNWSDDSGVCILESVNVAREGKKRESESKIPKKLIARIHRVIFGERHRRSATKAEMAGEVMDWNDSVATSETQVKDVLREAASYSE